MDFWSRGQFEKGASPSFKDPLNLRAKVPAGAKWLYANVILKGETGERFYPEALVSSPAVRP